MAAAQQPITARFQQIVHDLLYDFAPPAGAAALMLRRGLGSSPVYFPIGFAPGSPMLGSDSILKNYFLYATHWAKNSGDYELVLGDDSGLEALVLQGKLALALFHAGPVAISAHPCDPPNQSSQSDVLLCTLRPASASSISPPPSPYLRSALWELVALWRDTAASNLKIQASDHAIVADTLAAILADHLPEPPYFPTLHVRVDSRKAKNATPTPGIWKANPLSYNCFLLEHRQVLVDEFIRSMFLANKLAYIDTNIQSRDPLVSAIVSVCDDFVQRVGLHEPSQTAVYARRNIAKSSYPGDPARDPRVTRNLAVSSSLWHVLRHSLLYLQKHDGDSALVTLWAGAATEANELLAIPMGFMPGARDDLLAQAALNEDLQKSSRHKTFKSRPPNLVVTVILPGSDDEEVTKYELSTKRDIEPALDQAGSALDPRPVRYSGPYSLDFQHDVRKPCHLSDADNVHVGSLLADETSTTGDERLTYWLLVELAVRSTHFMAKNEFTQWQPTKGMDYDDIAYRVREHLRKMEIDPFELLVTIPRKGLKLHPTVKSKNHPPTTDVDPPRRRRATSEAPAFTDSDLRSDSASDVVEAFESICTKASLTSVEIEVLKREVQSAAETLDDFRQRLGLTPGSHRDALESAKAKVQLSRTDKKSAD